MTAPQFCEFDRFSVGAMEHCPHWHPTEEGGGEGPCCWCGSDEDDAGTCTPEVDR